MSRSLLLGVAVMAMVSLCFAVGLAPRPDDERPPVFDTRPYAQAKAAAAKDKKWFIVKATAVWCGPCKAMNRTTWRDEKVVAWVKANAVAVEIDVDKEEEIAKDLGIEAMPTMIAFKEGGKEFDRVVGYKAPAEFLPWLEGIAKGEKSIEAVKQKAAAAKGNDNEVQTRYDLAQKLLEQREYEKATQEFEWLWANSAGTSFSGVRGSFMAGEMQRLAKAYAPAKKRFTQLRDEKTKATAGDKVDPNDLDDWIVLNEIIGDEARTLEWFDKVKTQPRWRPLIERSSFRLERLLIDNKRWADIGNLYPDAITKLERDHEIMEMTQGRAMAGLDEQQRKEFDAIRSRMFREKAGKIYAGLLAAGRDKDAGKFAARARELDQNSAMLVALVDTALTAGQARDQQVEWLEGTAPKDADAAALLKKLKGELEKTEKK